ncbi:MAG: ABC transporter permease subunit, partial [Phascolarctobacterium sp.]|nr:ABC transporter permease subunit [Phascolarctobacterium sp.]
MDYIISIIPQMLAGCQVTAQVFFFTIILSIPLGLVLAFGRVSNLSLVKHFIAFYVWVMRGTPLML